MLFTGGRASIDLEPTTRVLITRTTFTPELIATIYSPNMLVFITGAAGFIGRAVTKELLSNGHQVLGLARNDANASIITAAGGSVLHGSLEDIESLKTGAQQSDAVIHLAYIHDFTNLAKSNELDRAGIAAMAEVLAGTGKPLLIASGTLGVVKGDVAKEDTADDMNHPMSDRARATELLFQLAKEQGFRGASIRFAPTVHGDEDKGLIPMMIGAAQKAGSVTYIGDGTQRWPAVNRFDAAVLCRLAVEKCTGGARYHAVAEQGVPMKDIMTLVGEKLSLPVESKTVEEAGASMGFFANIIALDNPTSSEKTQKELGWKPAGPGLLEDMEKFYFN